jgi:hypothetical protein
MYMYVILGDGIVLRLTFWSLGSIHMQFSMIKPEKGDLLIQVTA